MDGKRVRQHLRGATREEVEEEVRGAHGQGPRQSPARVYRSGGASGTFGWWLHVWITEVVPGYAKPSTWANYEGAVRRSVMPALGPVFLARLQEEDIERLLDTIPTPSSRQLVLKTVKAALTEAKRRRLVRENVAERVKIRVAPAVFYEDEAWEGDHDTSRSRRRAIPPEDLAAVLAEMRHDRLHARWMLGLLGCRRAEVLGLVWQDLTHDGILQLRRNRVRPTYRHGCPSETPCGHSPGQCPDRLAIGQIVGVKTSSSARDLPLGPGALAVLRDHRQRQADERASSAVPWKGKREWMFTTPAGTPLSHDADYRLWKQLLKRAGVNQSYKPHELRHTAASLLGAKDIDDATLMALMGWSTSRMISNYRHPLTGSMRKALEDLEQDLL